MALRDGVQLTGARTLPEEHGLAMTEEADALLVRSFSSAARRP